MEHGTGGLLELVGGWVEEEEEGKGGREEEREGIKASGTQSQWPLLCL